MRRVPDRCPKCGETLRGYTIFYRKCDRCGWKTRQTVEGYIEANVRFPRHSTYHVLTWGETLEFYRDGEKEPFLSITVLSKDGRLVALSFREPVRIKG